MQITNQRSTENSTLQSMGKVQEFKEKVIEVTKVSKSTKGGKQMAFTALVVVGDGNGKVGIGLGKAKNVADAISKGTNRAKRSMFPIQIKNSTIPHSITYKFKSARILLRPGKAGGGIIAGGAVRAIAEAAGIKDIVSKIFGSRNKSLNVWATFQALQKLKA